MTPVTLRWVVTKTINIPLKHDNALLKLTLFWDPARLRNSMPRPAAEA